ncbi:MAG: DUF1549 domain-containing protein [Pirellulaceae bacterium]
MTLASLLLLSAALAAPAAGPDVSAASTKLDEVIADGWRQHSLQPAPLCDDATFLRRIWLDLAGRIPPAAETKKFLEEKNSSKRQEAVEKLLASPEFANHWGRVWAEYFTDQRPFDQDEYSGRVLQNYFRDSFLAGKSYKQVAAELLRGDGPSDASGPANFLLRYDVQPEQLAGVVSKKFLGATIQCAQCHDHPHVHWKQDEFWGLAAYFARLRKMEPTEEPNGDNFSLVIERTRGELQVPDPKAQPDAEGNRPKKTIYPRLPGEGTTDTSDERRAALISWLTSEQNPYFARHATNRVWKQLFGTELVNSLDSLAPQAKTSSSPILELLAGDFAQNGHDVKRLVRVIVLSNAYQRSAGPAKEVGGALAAATPPTGGIKKDGKPDEKPADGKNAPASSPTVVDPEHLQTKLYARFPIRPLTADQLYLSIAQSTGYRGADEAQAKLAEMTKEDFTTDVAQESLSAEALAIRRSLAVLNGDHVRAACDQAVTTAQALHGEVAGPKHIEHLFLATLSRKPTGAEMDAMLDLAGASEGSEGLTDVTWVLLNSAEFNTNH